MSASSRFRATSRRRGSALVLGVCLVVAGASSANARPAEVRAGATVPASATTSGTGTAAATVVADTEESAVERYIRRVYLDLFDRAPDPTGMAGWTAALNSGTPESRWRTRSRTAPSTARD
ncbi:DUF4214 domain-containing protein [Cellulomonas sp. KRMCY2]|uniref:DUF4214 domain-containing protein n=1 Tax=Cellulomonas sp. KRMCY2 TaxID=1304865 RepID=UPI00045E73DC|nr:DUF4214 domain-containing protein [Cellulomonas sp. KRMCY2]